MRILPYIAGTALLAAAPIFAQEKREGSYVFHSFGTPTAVCRIYPNYKGDKIATCDTRDVEMVAKQGKLVLFRNSATFPGYVQIGSKEECSDKSNVENLIRGRCIGPDSKEAVEMQNNFTEVAGNTIVPGNIVSPDYARGALSKITGDKK